MASLHTFCLVFISSLFVGCLLSPSSYAGFLTHQCSLERHIDNSSFRSTLTNAFSDLVSVSSISESHHSTFGGPIYASFNCWRNIPSQVCKRCVKSATKSILRLCPGHQGATVWNSDCTLHYVTSNDKTLSTIDQGKNIPWAWWYSVSRIEEVTNQEQFDDSLNNIMSSLIDKATNSTNSARLFATGEVMVTIFDTLYGMVECSPSKNPKICESCLRAAMERLTGCCGGSRVVEVIMPSCRLGYDLGPSMSRASLVGPFASSSFPNMDSKSIAIAKK